MKKLLAALLCGLVAAVLVGLSLRHEKRKISEHFTMATVLSAKKYVGSGKELTPALVEEIAMPLAYLPPGALRNKSELLDPRGRARYKTRIGLLKSDVISKPKLIETSGLVGLAWTLQPGEVALTLKLTPPGALGGLVQPGDWVNILWVDDQKSRLLLPHVRVAAVGDQIWDPAGGGQEISKQVASDGFLITLVLTPHASLVTAQAAEKGNLILNLCSPLDVGG